VQLSGFVNSVADQNKAVEVARGVSGVNSVKNDMQLKRAEKYVDTWYDAPAASITNWKPPQMPNTPFLTDIETLRKRAREHIDEGSVTAGYSADRAIVLKLLNDSLA